MSIFNYFGQPVDTDNEKIKSYKCLQCETEKKRQINYRASVGVATSNLTKHLRNTHPELFKELERDQAAEVLIRTTPYKSRKLDFASPTNMLKEHLVNSPRYKGTSLIYYIPILIF